MSREVELQVKYKGMTYNFNFGSEVYVFDSAVCNGFLGKYAVDLVFDYIDLVHECYLKDNNQTPLGALADFIAKHWEELKEQNYRDILAQFYNEICDIEECVI